MATRLIDVHAHFLTAAYRKAMSDAGVTTIDGFPVPAWDVSKALDDMDTNGIETVNVRPLGGTDNVTVGDLTGTDVDTVSVDLSGTSNTPDGAADTVTVDGTSRRDRVDVSRFGSTISVAGLQAETNIFGSDPTLDTLQIQTFEGTDDVTVAQDVADLIVPVIDLGADQ